MSFQIDVVYSLKNADLVDKPSYQLSNRIRFEKVNTGEKLKDGTPLKDTKVFVTIEVAEDSYLDNPAPYCEQADRLMGKIKKACGIMGKPLDVAREGIKPRSGAPPIASPSDTIGIIPILLEEHDIKHLQVTFNEIKEPQTDIEKRLDRIGEFLHRGYKFHVFESDQELGFYNFWRACEIAGRSVIEGKIVHRDHWQWPGEEYSFGFSEECFTAGEKETFGKTKKELRKIQPNDLINDDEYEEVVEDFQKKGRLGHTLDLCYALRGEIFHYGNTNEEVLSVLYWVNELLSEVIVPEFLELMEGKNELD